MNLRYSQVYITTNPQCHSDAQPVWETNSHGINLWVKQDYVTQGTFFFNLALILSKRVLGVGNFEEAHIYQKQWHFSHYKIKCLGQYVDDFQGLGNHMYACGPWSSPKEHRFQKQLLLFKNKNHCRDVCQLLNHLLITFSSSSSTFVYL